MKANIAVTLHNDAMSGGRAFVHVINGNFIESDVKDRTASLVNSIECMNQSKIEIDIEIVDLTHLIAWKSWRSCE